MKISKALLTVAYVVLFVSCGNKNEFPDIDPGKEEKNFAKGADIGWITEMESNNVKFYNSAGVQMDGIALLKSLGMNSIRLRVWVNPTNGWNSKEDVLVKAKRAAALGMKVMINFHYSDSWADPGQQNKPAAWVSLSFDQLKSAVNAHTKDVLDLLKKNNIAVGWVQVGNETGNGMLWNEGKADQNMSNYAQLTNAGYDAVKAIYSNAKVIVHIHNGWDNNLFRWIFDGLKSNGAKWDVVGMSLYPSKDNWSQMTEQCISNIRDMISRYNKEVMICEVGLSWDEEAAAEAWLKDLFSKSQAISNNKVLGVFYWEPLAHNNWKGYTLGAFNNAGRPTKALNAFK
ncbi:glycoside hydrolase family 53 protein [Sphingobacterium litopenaei]|uniref:Arabinogalactan endo-beta-1,4-galactanase n=1 Tax=Sphingobacterium litopenaei TaxID=2763500 RepID=A0ABR7YAP5_9SPHI|nr:glycosyl hydrolase 53 family protein [Sphingobacterium litopenaei]MBD1428378.1 glycosyl hydrolase 53 family protein [Sphingobacterium litopenaei]